MLTHFMILVAGILLLYYGSCWLVNGSSELALSFSIRPAVVGLTVVAFATSAPELLVSIVAAVSGSSGVSVGNILGSNVINIALVLGLSALVKPVIISKQLVKRELPYMCGATVLFWFLCMDGNLGRVDGFVLICTLLIFLVYNVINAKDNNKVQPTDKPGKVSTLNITLVIVGLVSIALGADWIVKSAVFFARSFNLSELFIGISIVAIGTSLPELATSVVAAFKKQSDISVGNIVGSNLFNICMVMGAVGLINPIKINPGLNHFEFPAMVFVTLLLFVFSALSNRIGRRYGLVFIVCFFIYNITAYLFAH